MELNQKLIKMFRPESPRPEAEENTTTLIHDEAESFALAPIELDATTMRGITKAKR